MTAPTGDLLAAGATWQTILGGTPAAVYCSAAPDPSQSTTTIITK